LKSARKPQIFALKKRKKALLPFYKTFELNSEKCKTLFGEVPHREPAKRVIC